VVGDWSSDVCSSDLSAMNLMAEGCTCVLRIVGSGV